uniref:protocadherin gamma-A12-like n=1 Tax=Euleptes europaea TaxID=460621 RepID=UPI002540BF0C|nr:protocadherin gamma-A12-like [Euleptes europaea]
MPAAKCLQDCKKGAVLCMLFASICRAISRQIHYTIPEESEKGSLVGNIAKDLGLDAKELSDHRIHLVSQGRSEYFALNYKNGRLYTIKRIDREEICGWREKCILNAEVIVGDSMKVYGVEVEITDINDHAPTFPLETAVINISENTALGSRFPLYEAQDPDSGNNSLQGYKLSNSSHFSLVLETSVKGKQYAKLVLQRPLDREELASHNLVLTAYDGGNPVKTGTIQLHVVVLDVNDNAPIFSQQTYEVSCREDIPIGTMVITLKAADLDEGVNKEIKFSFHKISAIASQIFHLDSNTGEITLVGNLDFEETPFHEMEVQVQDGGGLLDRATLMIFITDVNDNAPELTLTSVINSIPEDSPAGTSIALLKVQDKDSAENAEVTCSVPGNLPFLLTKSYDKYYSLVTSRTLDREQVAVYNITVTAMDHGTPPLSASIVISLKILDANDNPPFFLETVYTSYILENNPRGASIFSLKANDPDWGENSRITYSIVEEDVKDSSLSSYLSINSETGIIYALCSFDYEEFQQISFFVKAQDGGSPSLSTRVAVTLLILDQNDNAPQILYPSSPTDGSTGVELAPHSSDPEYLVTKVVAVDVDSGQNAWLSYQLLKATEPGLFTIGLHTGEIRTARFFLDKDTLKQSLVVLVKDNGQPPLSASVTVTVVLANSIPESLSDISSISAPADSQSDLTFYLVVAVAFVSCLFFTFLLVLLALRLHKWRNSQLCDSGGLNFTGVPVSQFVGIDGVQAFLHSYCHDFSLTTDSRKSNFGFPKVNSSNTLRNEESCEIKDPFLMTEDISSSHGNPPLSTHKIISLLISDINDNSPSFEKSSYTIYVPENNPSGASIFTVKALDPDMDQNSRITYSILHSNIKELPISSYISINSETGALYAQRSFDYEQFREFQLQVKAQDGGSPPLSSNVTVRVFILDRNDNSPRILSPSQEAKGSALFEMVPRSAEEGYLVTKVVAVDADSGHNAWLSYHVVQATEPGFFTVGSHTGEIRTSRAFVEKDAVKQKLVILVKDNGQPSLSATMTLNLVFAENFQEALPEMKNQSSSPDYQSDLQFYLVLALALMSFLFLLTVILAILMKLRKSGNPKFLQCFAPVPHSKAGAIFPPNFEDGTLPYSYQLCLSSESRKNEFTFLTPNIQIAGNVLGSDNLGVPLTGNEQNNSNLVSENTEKELYFREGTEDISLPSFRVLECPGMPECPGNASWDAGMGFEGIEMPVEGPVVSWGSAAMTVPHNQRPSSLCWRLGPERRRKLLGRWRGGPER